MKKLKQGEIAIQEVSWHRNGISGEGFYAVRFQWGVSGSVENFIATVFDAPGHCAVLSLDRMNKSGVAFGENSWRGDEIEDRLRQAIEARSEINRVGPFSV